MAAVRLFGAAPLATLMATERMELEWGRASSCGVAAPNASAASLSSNVVAEALPLEKRSHTPRQRSFIARLAFPDHER